MKKIMLFNIFIFLFLISCNNKNIKTVEAKNNTYEYNGCEIKLTDKEYKVIAQKGTELPFTGALLNNKEEGVYNCKVCGTPLFRSEDKFDSGTGWPSFDDAIVENIKLLPDGDRLEVVCAVCGAHLGHVFYNEGFTEKATRYCINSVSLSFDKKLNSTNK